MQEEQWKEKLTPEQYKVLREKGTEPPFSGEFLHHNETGAYTCAGCGAEIFTSEHKYDSDIPGLSGWPSFAEVKESGTVKLLPDDSYGMHRTEVVCAQCDGHLGHLFDDHTSPTGKHYCINSCALEFKKQDE